MEEQKNLETIEIGTIEAKKLKPTTVKIVKAYIEIVGDKNAKKVVCESKHPDSEDTIKISSVKMEKKKKLEVSGLWLNLDKEEKIRKDSVLALFLQLMKAKNIQELDGKECPTIEDDAGYLVFKGY